MLILRLLSPSALSFIPEVAAEAAEVKAEAEAEVAAHHESTIELAWVSLGLCSEL